MNSNSQLPAFLHLCQGIKKSLCRGLLDLHHDVLDLLTDLGGVGGDQLGQLFDLAVQGGAQLLGGVLQLLGQGLGLALQDGGDVAQLLACDLAGLLDVGLNILLHCLQVLGGAGLDLTHVGGDGAWVGKEEEENI